MRLSTLLVALSILSFSTGLAENSSLAEEADVPGIKAFIASAPKATSKVDLSYAIKIPEKERRQAIVRCQEILARDKANDKAHYLLGELQDGEGPQEAVAVFRESSPEASRGFPGDKKNQAGSRYSEVLRANLIPFSLAGSRGWALNVYKSHADRARFLLAQLVLREGLEAMLGRSTEDGARWVEVKPEDAIHAYRE